MIDAMTHAISPAPARPRWERRKEARPAELLAAALELFVEKGFSGTRLEDVAARAGVSKGTLYLYFENKEDLFKEVVRQNLVTRITQARDEIASFDGPAPPVIDSLFTTWWQHFGATPACGISKLMMAESGNFPEIASFFLEEVIEPWHGLLASAIERGIARGEFCAVDVPTFVRVITAPLVMLSLWKTSFGACSRHPIDTEAYLATTRAMVQSALAPAGASCKPE